MSSSSFHLEIDQFFAFPSRPFQRLKPPQVHYLTSSQLEEFYDDYYSCPVQAFNTNTIDFAKLPLAKYRMQELNMTCIKTGHLFFFVRCSFQKSQPPFGGLKRKRA